MITLTVEFADISGDAGTYTLFLRTAAGALVNAGGDAGTESPAASGRWEFSVAEALTADLRARIYEGTTETAANLVWVGAYALGETELRPEWPVIRSTGTGPRTVTITVDDGATAIDGARVSVTKSGVTHTATTNASGQVVFNLDDGTWTVAITAALHTFAGAALVVDGDETQTYSMTAVAITGPPSASTSTGVLQVYNHEGVAESGVEISVEITKGPGTAGYAYDSKPWTETSDGTGLLQFAGLIRGATYTLWRGSSRELAVSFTVPDLASFNIAELIGED